jgi:hypothetical protein
MIVESYTRGPRGFNIIGDEQVGFHIRATGNHRVLSGVDKPLKTLEIARDWLTHYYPGVMLQKD